MVGCHIDITRLKQAEEKLKQRNPELVRFNCASVKCEQDMIALKQRVNALSVEFGGGAPFDLSAVNAAEVAAKR
jgi:hypothetical protein